MKKIIMILALLCASISIFSQSSAYLESKQIVLNNGYTIVDEKEADISQGNYLFNYRTFIKGNDYVIVAASDDYDVLDVDIYLYYMDGDVRNKDNDDSRIAVINFSPSTTIDLKISVYNYLSKTPTYLSKCRYFIAYK